MQEFASIFEAKPVMQDGNIIRQYLQTRLNICKSVFKPKTQNDFKRQN